MTDSPELRRRRRRRASGDGSDRASGRPRPLVALGGIVAVVIVAGGIAFGLGGGFGGPAPLPPSPGATGNHGAANTSFPALPGGSSRPEATPEPAAGIRATRIRIDSLGIDLPVIEGDGIDAPMNKAAHYPGSAWPDGASKNIYIYGHAQEGMFINLWEAQPGTEVILDLDDGTERTYIVTQVLPKVAWDALEYTEPTPTEQLTLQTSTSDTITAPRFVVIAVPNP